MSANSQEQPAARPAQEEKKVHSILGVEPIMSLYGVEIYTRKEIKQALNGLTDPVRVAINMGRVVDGNTSTPVVGPIDGIYQRDVKTGQIQKAKINGQMVPVKYLMVADQARRGNFDAVLVFSKESFLLIPRYVAHGPDMYLFATGPTKKTNAIPSLATNINAVAEAIVDTAKSNAGHFQKAFTQEMSLRKMEDKGSLGTWKQTFTGHLSDFISADSALERDLARNEIIDMKNSPLIAAFYVLRDLLLQTLSLEERAEELRGQNESGMWTEGRRLQPVVPVDEKYFNTFGDNDVTMNLINVSKLKKGDHILAHKGPKMGIRALKDLIINDSKVVVVDINDVTKDVRLLVTKKKRGRSGKASSVEKPFLTYPADALRILFELGGRKKEREVVEKMGEADGAFDNFDEDAFF